MSSSYTAAAYLDDIGYKQRRLAAGLEPSVLLMGSSGMRDELEAVGLQVRVAAQAAAVQRCASAEQGVAAAVWARRCVECAQS